MLSFVNSHALAAAAILLPSALLATDVETKFHNAPVSAQAAKNQYAGQEEGAQAGKMQYGRNCLSCHGWTGNGGKTSSLQDGRPDSVARGDVFWFTRGNKDNGMPARCLCRLSSAGRLSTMWSQ
jgi:mono/diheme cytochrome c family protein